MTDPIACPVCLHEETMRARRNEGLAELSRLVERIDAFRSRLQPESHPLAQGSYDALGLVMRDITARIRELEESDS